MRIPSAIAAASLVVFGTALAPASLAAQQANEPHVQWQRLEAPVLNAASPLAVRDRSDDDWSPQTRAVAGAASLMVPGAGQFYKGERLKGAVMLTTAAAAITYAFVAGIGDGELCAGSGPTAHCQTVPNQMNHRFFLGLGTAAGIQAWSVVDALSARR